MAAPWRVGLCTYGHTRRRMALNSVLLCHAAIRRALAEDPRFVLRDYTPPLRDDRDVDFEAASRVHERVERDLDAVVVQASSPGLECLQRAAERSPGAVRIVHRDSSHARYCRDALRAEQERRGIRYKLHYDGPLLDRELAEYNLSDFATVPSRWVQRTFAENGYDRTVHVGPQVIELGRWRGHPRRFRAGEQVFLFAGQLGLRKGVLDLLEAWRMADAPGRLVVAGLPDAAESAPAIAAALEASPRTSAVGHVAFPQMADLYRSASCLVMPSLEEGSAMVCCEAMAGGLPLIGTPSAGCDLLVDGATGVEVPAARPEVLAAAIRRYAADDGERYAHGLAAARAAQACDVALYARRYAAAVAGMLS